MRGGRQGEGERFGRGDNSVLTQGDWGLVWGDTLVWAWHQLGEWRSHCFEISCLPMCVVPPYLHTCPHIFPPAGCDGGAQPVRLILPNPKTYDVLPCVHTCPHTCPHFAIFPRSLQAIMEGLSASGRWCPHTPPTPAFGHVLSFHTSTRVHILPFLPCRLLWRGSVRPGGGVYLPHPHPPLGHVLSFHFSTHVHTCSHLPLPSPAGYHGGSQRLRAVVGEGAGRRADGNGGSGSGGSRRSTVYTDRGRCG